MLVNKETPFYNVTQAAEILGFHESYISLLLQGKRKNKLFED